MKFEYLNSNLDKVREEIYSQSDSLFDCQPAANVDINIAIAYLNIGVDSEDMCVKCLWGFSPEESWTEENLSVPDAVEGKLKLIGEYEAGLTWRLDRDSVWKSYIDKRNGWYCIGNPYLEGEYTAVKVLEDMILVMDKLNELKAVWVHPKFI